MATVARTSGMQHKNFPMGACLWQFIQPFWINKLKTCMFNKDAGVAFTFLFKFWIYYCQCFNSVNAHFRFETTSNIVLCWEIYYASLVLWVIFSGCLPSPSSLREFKISQEQLFFSFILFDNLFSLAFLTINTP